MVVGPSAATGDAVTLEYRAPAGCPDEQEVLAMVNEALDSVPTVEARHQVRAVALVDDDQSSLFRLELEIDDGDAVRRRSLTDASCRELMHTGAVLVAIAVDPRIAAAVSHSDENAAPDEPESETSTVPVPPPSLAVREAQPTEAQPAAKPDASPVAPLPRATPQQPKRRVGNRSPAQWDLAAAGGAGFNLLPGFAASASMTLGVQRSRWRVESVATGLPSKRGGTSAASGRFSLVTIGVRGCGVFETEALLLPLCGGVSVGGIRGRATDTPQTSTAWFPWLSAHAGPSLHWRVHPRVRPFAGAGFIVPVLRGTFVVAPEPDLIHRPGVVGFSAQAGISVSLGEL